jgi:predicted acetylornithine/succinylornithine family transaminase
MCMDNFMRSDVPQEARSSGSSREERALERLAHLTPNYRPQPRLFVRGEGSRLYDADGRVYLDLVCGIATCALGHCHPALVEALTDQAGRLWHTSNLYLTEPAPRLAELLAAHSFADRVFFANSGTEANEAAIKLARRFHHDQGTPRAEIVVFESSFHGRTLGSLSATAQPKYHVGFGPLVPGFVVVKYGDPAALAAVMSERTAAVMLEPIQGEGGVVVPPPGFLEEVRALCNHHGALMILDEVQTGMGRTGKLWAYEHSAITPDILTAAKALGGGMPIGCMLASERCARSFVPGTHASTFGGNPLAAAVATRMLEELVRGGVLAGVAMRARRLREAIDERLVGRGVSGVRGQGLLLALDVEDKAQALARRALEAGVLVNALGEHTLRITPSLVISDEEIEGAVERLAAVL